MPQSLARLWVHLIFSTKDRYPFLSDKTTRLSMHAYLATVLRSHDCETVIVGGIDDHVHALFALSRTHSIAHVVQEIKRTSSAWIKEKSHAQRQFHWQSGYGAFSVGQSQLDRVTRYIEQQEERHCGSSFQDEFRSFLKKYKVEHDEDIFGIEQRVGEPFPGSRSKY